MPRTAGLKTTHFPRRTALPEDAEACRRPLSNTIPNQGFGALPATSCRRSPVASFAEKGKRQREVGSTPFRARAAGPLSTPTLRHRQAQSRTRRASVTRLPGRPGRSRQGTANWRTADHGPSWLSTVRPGRYGRSYCPHDGGTANVPRIRSVVTHRQPRLRLRACRCARRACRCC